MNETSKTISLIKVYLQNAALTKCYNGLKKEDPQFVRLFRIHDEKNEAKRYGLMKITNVHVTSHNVTDCIGTDCILLLVTI